MVAVECVVIGAGVVGLAIAKALSEQGREVVVLEKADTIGTGISSRNSEVIHAGIYYPFDSLMRHLCISGRDALYAYCGDRAIPHARCGKLIVAATPEEAGRLDGIATRALENGVSDLVRLSAREALDLEPELNCVGALLSPSTGIVDSHSYMLSMRGDAERAGAVFAFLSPFMSAEPDGSGMIVQVGGVEPMELRCGLLINAAGLDAPAVARRISGLDAACIPKSYYAKGSYFTLSGRSPFKRLIYPVPVPGGLGTHLTLDLQGNARFGPDVEWIDDINYVVNPAKAAEFVKAISRYWPQIDPARLQPGYSGIRPKIVPPGAPAQDFVIQTAADHGIKGLINLFGIEFSRTNLVTCHRQPRCSASNLRKMIRRMGRPRTP